MLIISKHKDFYDHVCHQYKDEKKVIDRRNAPILDGTYLYHCFNRAIKYRMFDAVFNDKRINDDYIISLQIGYSVKYFQVIRITVNKNTHDSEVVLKHIEDETSDTVKLMEVEGFNVSRIKGFQTGRIIVKDRKFKRELFSENGVYIISFFASFYTAEEVYKNLDDYFVYQQRDIGTKPIPDDKAKIVNHGFDLKTSFRGK